jgi:hypothetical protein
LNLRSYLDQVQIKKIDLIKISIDHERWIPGIERLLPPRRGGVACVPVCFIPYVSRPDVPPSILPPLEMLFFAGFTFPSRPHHSLPRYWKRFQL